MDLACHRAALIGHPDNKKHFGIMKRNKLTGLVAATHTPFAADGSLRLAVVEQQAEYLIKQEVNAVFIGGSTGESHSLSVGERHQLAQRWSEVARGTLLKIVVHVGSNCLADAKELANQAARLNALAISALAPSYFKPRSLTDLVEWCAEIAASAPDTPFYLYDIPSLTNVAFSMPAFLAKASDRIPTLGGIKFTNHDLMAYQLCLRADGGALDIPWGMDESLLAALALGAVGAVGSSYNFAAPVYHRLIARFNESDLAGARQEQLRSVELIHLLSGYGYLGAAKALMRMLGVDVGPVRLPNTNPTADQIVRLREELEELGFFDWIQPAKPVQLSRQITSQNIHP